MKAQEILEKYGQKQLLKYKDSLSAEEYDRLIKQIETIDFSVLDELKKDRTETLKRGLISPVPAMELDEINQNRDRFKAIGTETLKAGKVAAVLLAGGMGTRLGSDDPKGMYNIGIDRDLYIFECQINNLLEVVHECGAYPHIFIMTSELNDEKTRKFWKEKNCFGYPEDKVTFFCQAMAPTCDYDGNVFLEAPGRVSVSPNGNGGWFVSMMNAGVYDKVKELGIEWFNLYGVDNVCQRICDPVFIGAVIDRKCAVGSKVVRKNDPDEKMGVMCLEDGHPSIIEYTEMTPELRNTVDSRGERVYNFGVILNYLFRVADLEEIVKHSMPYHIVEKKINHLGPDGEPVKPETPCGYKFEQFVLDMIRLADDCLPFEVVRDYEFAPVKNRTGVDSVESARELLKKNGVTL